MMKPYGNRVMVEVEKQGEKTSGGGIVIPESADNSNVDKGTVVGVGTGRVNADGQDVPMSIVEGNIVLFTKYAGTSFKAEEKEYKIINADDIIGIEG